MECPRCGSFAASGRFCAACGAPLADARADLPAPASLTASGSETAADDARERRHLTVMVYDLVGFAALAARLEPDELDAALATHRARVADVVSRFEGYIAERPGDGARIWFGYPHPQEDDAERAVRAALDMIEAVQTIRPRVDAAMQCRIGVATGLVTIGPATRPDQPPTISGDPIVLAKGMQTLAAPDMVVVPQSTRRLLGRLFEWGDLGIVQVRGIASPVQAWRVLGPTRVASRFEALRGEGVRPLAGRQSEMQLLLSRCARAQQGEGQVVLLRAQPGLGKSRLIAAIEAATEHEALKVTRFFCSPYHASSALYPVVDHLMHAAAIAHDDAAETKREKLEALLEPALLSGEDVALLAELLSIPLAGALPTPPLDPEVRKGRTFKALTDYLLATTRRTTGLVVWEDIHWIDPTSRELLDHLVERSRSEALLLLVTSRLINDPGWLAAPHVAVIELARLGPADSAALVRGIDGQLPAAAVDEIVGRGGGVPLFLEELTKSWLTEPWLENAGQAAGNIPAATTIPETLQALLFGRINRLGDAREIAQIAAAIGREFSLELLAEVAARPVGKLSDAMARLLDTGLIAPQGAAPHTVYEFRHALIRDATYDTLLPDQRGALHARIARALETTFPAVAKAQPELLADHLARAGAFERAVTFRTLAAEGAFRRAGWAEAIANIRAGLALVPRINDAAVRHTDEIDLQLQLVRALLPIKGLAAAEVGAAVAIARRFCDRLEDATRLRQVLRTQWIYLMASGDVRQALANAERLSPTTASPGDASAALVADYCIGTSLLSLGRPIAARLHLERAARLDDERGGRSTEWPLGLGGLQPYLAINLLILGYPEQAAARCEHALAIAAERSRPRAVALGIGSRLWLYARDFAKARRWSEAQARIAAEHGLVLDQRNQKVIWGRIMVASGEPDGCDLMAEALHADREHGVAWGRPGFVALYAEACAEAGRLADGLEALSGILAVIESTEEREPEAELFRVRGLIERRLGRRDDAETSLRRAVAVASAQQAKFWELRAAHELASLLREQGRREEAHATLAPVYAWFTEGFDFADLRDAKALVDELAVEASQHARA